MVGGIATNKITAIGSGSAEAEAVEAALKPTASKTLDVVRRGFGVVLAWFGVVWRGLALFWRCLALFDVAKCGVVSLPGRCQA